MQEMLLSSGIMQTMLDAAVTSRFELVMFAVSLMLYYVLYSSRCDMKAVHKKKYVAVDDSEELEATNENCEEEAPSVHLARVFGSMKLCVMSQPSHVSHVSTELTAFLEKYPEYPFDVSDVQSILNFCGSGKASGAEAVPDLLFDRMQSTQDWQLLLTFILFYINIEEFDKACDIFELKYSTFFDFELDEDMEWRLIVAALRCGRQTLANHLLQTSQSDAAMKVMSIQKWWKRTAANLSESRVERMGSVLNRLSSMFNERFPFEEHSDDESTCFLGEESDCEDSDDESWSDEFDR